jgi:hypothetical protein
VLSIAVDGNKVFAGTYDQGVFRSTDNGIGWAKIGSMDISIQALVVSGTDLFAALFDYRAPSEATLLKYDGKTWSVINTDLIKIPYKCTCS